MRKWFFLMVFASPLFIMGTFSHADEYEAEHNKACTVGPYFISPKDGETVGKELPIKMGIKGLNVHKAGELIEGTGHHHLIIDGSYVAENDVVAKDEKHIHFGKGQTETTVKLTPGKHTLTLQFADGFHQSYGEIMSRTIQVTVQ